MKVKIKKVYYCEYCNKHSLRPLVKHEKHCTSNPNRKCNVCGNSNITELIEQYKNSYKLIETEFGLTKVEWKGIEIKAKGILMDVEGCPACALTIIKNAFTKCGGYIDDFDYRKEHDKYWNERNKEARENDEHISLY